MQFLFMRLIDCKKEEASNIWLNIVTKCKNGGCQIVGKLYIKASDISLGGGGC